MALVTCKEILDEANIGNYAVPGFDTIDHASVEAVISAAEERNQPVILMFPEEAVSLVDMESFFAFMVEKAKSAKVPVALEYDHGKEFGNIVKAIRYGFSSVMVDGSELPFEENVAFTKKVVEVAHAAGVSVEAEIGHVAGGEGNMDGGSEIAVDLFTKPEEAKRFYEETQVDALAVAFGTVHGLYKGTPVLDLERLQKIKELVPVPLVMHGGSGVSDEAFLDAVKCGINKVNFFTEISMAAVEQSVAHCQKKDNKLHFIELILVAKKTVSTMAGKYLDLLR